MNWMSLREGANFNSTPTIGASIGGSVSRTYCGGLRGGLPEAYPETLAEPLIRLEPMRGASTGP